MNTLEKTARKNITITVDKNYCIFAAVMLHSFFLNNAANEYYIHIVTNVRNPFFKIPLYYILKKHRAKYTFYFIDEKTIQASGKVVITLHITIATYFRLFLPSVLDKIDKTLFLDSDMIIDGKLNELYDTNIEQYALGAVSTPNEERTKTLNLSNAYFNAGVMLLNLSYLRTNNFEPQFMQFIQAYPEKIIFWDQDVLNATTGKFMLPIATKWNGMANLINAGETTRIIHYAGSHKPWSGHSEHPLKDKYFQYLQTDFVLQLLEKCYRFYFRTLAKLKK